MTSRTPNLAEVIRTAISTRLCDVHTMLPGKIVSYDAAAQKADVQPLIRRLQKAIDGEIKERLPQIPGVPVAWPRSGKYRLTMPVKAGDFCMLVFSESSIDAYQAGQGQEVDPGAFYRFDLTDAVALMGWNPDGQKLGETDSSVISVGLEGGSFDFIAHAQKTFDEITALRDAVDSLVSTYNAHSVSVNVPALGLVAPMGGGPVTGSATGISVAPGDASAPPSVNSVANSDVKVS